MYTRTSGFAQYIQSTICANSNYPPSSLGCGTCIVEQLAYENCLQSRYGASTADACIACVTAAQPTTVNNGCSDYEFYACQAPYTCSACGGNVQDAAGQETCAVMLQHYLQCQTGCTTLCTQNTPAPVPLPQTASPAMYLMDDDKEPFCELQNQACHETVECCQGLMCYEDVCIPAGSEPTTATAMPPPAPAPVPAPVLPPTTSTTSTSITTFCGGTFMSCTSDGECCSTLACVNQVCQPLTTTVAAQAANMEVVSCQGATQACSAPSDCCPGLQCVSAVCTNSGSASPPPGGGGLP